MIDLLETQTATQAIKLLGSHVEYINQTGVKTNIYAIVEKNIEIYPDGFETGATQKRTEITFISSDVPNIKHGERIIRNSETFTVADVLEDDGAVVKVSVK